MLWHIIHSIIINKTIKLVKCLFGDNDIDNERKTCDQRKYYGGQAAITGQFDNNLCYGITTTFYNQQKKLHKINGSKIW